MKYVWKIIRDLNAVHLFSTQKKTYKQLSPSDDACVPCTGIKGTWHVLLCECAYLLHSDLLLFTSNNSNGYNTESNLII